MPRDAVEAHRDAVPNEREPTVPRRRRHPDLELDGGLGRRVEVRAELAQLGQRSDRRGIVERAVQEAAVGWEELVDDVVHGMPRNELGDAVR
jgi:hypothetical protein